MSELRNRMIQDMQLAGLVQGTQREYVRAVRQLAAYYLVRTNQLSERNVEDYLLYVRDELGVAKGTFAGLGRQQVLLPQHARLRLAPVAKKSPHATPATVA